MTAADAEEASVAEEVSRPSSTTRTRQPGTCAIARLAWRGGWTSKRRMGQSKGGAARTS